MTIPNSLPVIMLAFANDRANEARYLRNLPDELRHLREALRPAVDRKLCEVVELANATTEDIFKVFQSRKYRNRVAIFHFGGHAGGYQLLLESAEGHAESANAGGFAKFLAEQSSLELVFLNGCSTERQTKGLLDAGVTAVVSTSCAIDDKVATNLSRRFYRGLASGVGLLTAFRESIAAAETEAGGSTRALYAVEEETAEVVADRFPWDMSFRPGSESAADWNLPNTARNPLFGIPTPEKVDLPQTPYRHLQWFRREHAEVFFGRGEEIRDLYRKATNPDTAPIILFYGQSGVGKSSLLDAGLLPRLDTSQHVIYLRRDAEQGLSGTLDLAFLPEGVGLSPGDAWLAREKSLGRPLTVVLDQVEEVFTRPCGAVSDELGMFLDHVNEIFHDHETRPQGRLIVGFRKEWLAEITRQLADARLPYTEVFLERLDRRGVLEVVNGPASTERLKNQYGLEIENGLAQQIADDLLEDASGAVAPTLQILLSRMWETATRDGASQPVFSRDLYSSMRRQGLLLRDFLNRQLEFVEQRWPDVVSPDLLLDLLSLHTTAMGTAEQQLIADLQKSYSHHAAALPQILDSCRDAYLLTLPGSSADDDSATRLAHDTLAPLVRERFEMSDHPGQRARRILENRIVEWHGGAVGAPLDEVDLSIVEAGQSGMRAWTPDEERMIEASRAERRKRGRNLRIRKSLSVTAVVAIAALAGVAFLYAVNAENEQQKAHAAQLTAEDAQQRAEVAKLTAENARREAEEHGLAAVQATARSAIVPLRPEELVKIGEPGGPQRSVPQSISQPELDTLWTVIGEGESNTWKYVFTEAFSTPRLCERVANRSAELVRAAIGFHAERRNDTLKLIRTVLSGDPVYGEPAVTSAASAQRDSVGKVSETSQNESSASRPLKIDPEKVDWRVVCACAAVADELKPIDDELQRLITSRLLAELNIRDPRLLGEIGMMLARFSDSLSSAQGVEAIRHLLNWDKEKTGGSFPEKIGTAIFNLSDVPDANATPLFLRAVVDDWYIAEDTEQQMQLKVIERLSESVPEDAALDSWRYLNQHLGTYSKYSEPSGYFRSMGIIAEKVTQPEQLAKTLVDVLRTQEGGHLLEDYAPTLETLADRIAPEKFADQLGDEESWHWPYVHDWIRARCAPKALTADEEFIDRRDIDAERTVRNITGAWSKRSVDLRNFITKRNRHAVMEVLTDLVIKKAPWDARTAIEILAEIPVDPGAKYRRRIRTALLEQVLEECDPQNFPNDAYAIDAILRLGIPLDPVIETQIQERILRGLNAEDDAADTVYLALSLRQPPKGQFLARITDAAIKKIETIPLTADDEDFQRNLDNQCLFQKLLSIPGVTIPADKNAIVCQKVEFVYKYTLEQYTLEQHTLDLYGLSHSFLLERLPSPAGFLPQSVKSNIAGIMERFFKEEVGHADLAALAKARGSFGEPVSDDTRKQMLIKLSLWMYRLPPPDVNRRAPKLLAEAMAVLTDQTDDATRVTCLHSIMHAMLQLPFHDQSWKTLQQVLEHISSQCDSASLAEVLKSPWAIDDAQRIVLEILEDRSGEEFGGHYWAVHTHHKKLRLSIDDLESAVQFPEKLHYDAEVPTYAVAGASATRLGQGNLMEDELPKPDAELKAPPRLLAPDPEQPLRLPAPDPDQPLPLPAPDLLPDPEPTPLPDPDLLPDPEPLPLPAPDSLPDPEPLPLPAPDSLPDSST